MLLDSTKNLLNELSQIMPTFVDTAVKAGLQDARIGKIVGGLSLAAFGISSMAGSGVPKSIKAWYYGEPSLQNEAESASKKCLHFGIALLGLTSACYGIYSASIGIMELTHPEIPQNEFYLVSHDNKPKYEQKLGRPLPRIGVVNSETGEYHHVQLNGNPLSKAKDLESLNWIRQNQYLACESGGNCYQFSVNQNEEGYSAAVLNQFELPVPTDKFYNIEGVSLNGHENSVICWSHRGGIYQGEEPWIRCAPFDVDKGTVGEFTEMQVDDPFGIPNKLNRAISDQSIGPKTGMNYFVATIDTEGCEDIAATDDPAYSFLYTQESCLKLFPGEKVEGLYINEKETSAILATDNEAAGSKICKYSLESGDLSCVDVLPGEEYGIGGIAPLRLL